MQDWWGSLAGLLADGRWWSVMQALVIIVIGLLLARFLASMMMRLVTGRLDAHRSMILRRTAFYLVLGLAVATALNTLGFKLGVLLGTAGVLSVAIGFASQTSVSNLISGLFLVGERPFGIGDSIKVGATSGEVLAIDLLSVKLRTFDNLLVRIPNETLIKSEVVNLSRFPTRRVELALRIGYKEDIGRVRELLLQIAQNNPLCLQEPRPTFMVAEFAASSIDVKLLLWAKREHLSQLKNAMYEDIQRVFDREGIEMPYPHTSLYAGAGTEPIPIQVIEPPADG